MNRFDFFWIPFREGQKPPDPCCGGYPRLRIRPTLCFKDKIDYVQYECLKCKNVGGKGVTEDEALRLWNGE